MGRNCVLFSIFICLCHLITLSAKNSENPTFNISSHEVIHTEGVKKFYLGDYADALNCFEMITELASNDQVAPELTCSAFLGEAVCLIQLKETELALQSFNFFLESIDELVCPCTSNTMAKDDHPVVFKNPHEKITPRQCVERVRGTVNAIEKLVVDTFGLHSEAYRTFMMRVKILEEEAIVCCTRVSNPSSLWTTCLTPLLEIFQSWKKEMPVNPYCY